MLLMHLPSIVTVLNYDVCWWQKLCFKFLFNDVFAHHASDALVMCWLSTEFLAICRSDCDTLHFVYHSRVSRGRLSQNDRAAAVSWVTTLAASHFWLVYIFCRQPCDEWRIHSLEFLKFYFHFLFGRLKKPRKWSLNKLQLSLQLHHHVCIWLKALCHFGKYSIYAAGPLCCAFSEVLLEKRLTKVLKSGKVLAFLLLHFHCDEIVNCVVSVGEPSIMFSL